MSTFDRTEMAARGPRKGEVEYLDLAWVAQSELRLFRGRAELKRMDSSLSPPFLFISVGVKSADLIGGHAVQLAY